LFCDGFAPGWITSTAKPESCPPPEPAYSTAAAFWDNCITLEGSSDFHFLLPQIFISLVGVIEVNERQLLAAVSMLAGYNS
jgi:hypothetical protein